MRAFRDPASALTHLLGALLSAAGLVLLLVAAQRGSIWHLLSFAIFGITLILLYTTSTLYHALRLSEQGIRTLRKLDHGAIFLLIAGTYTPFCLIPLRGPWGWALLGTIWGLAAAGIVVKAFWMGAPRWLSTLLYVLMGWLVLIAFVPLVRSAPREAVAWLVAGGLIYTLGAVIYALKWPNLWPGRFDFHAVWHLFVMGGSISHFLAVYQLIG
ncbi:MAG: PAQR family membrane homeostasis protein TrhA [Bacillota bacterium]